MASLGDPSGYRGPLYKTTSPYPGPRLQGEQTAHTLEFNVDQSNIPVVVNHHITEGRTTYYVGDRLNLGSEGDGS